MKQSSYNYDKRAGQELRKLRQQRGITLEQASQLTRISMPMLSRKERGEGEVNRDTIRSAIAGYQLTMEESYHLWMAAGFLPEQAQSSSPASDDIQHIARLLLQNQPYPAFITDQLCYLRAWNQSLEAIWEPSQAEYKPVHIVDDLLSTRQRRRLGAQWEQYVLRSMKFFYRKTLLIARDPAVQHLLDTLYSRYGDLFVTKWNQAQNEEYISRQMVFAGSGASIIAHNTRYGPIQYVTTVNGSAVPHGYEFVIYVPVNAESQQRYQKFRSAMGGSTIYVASENPDSEFRSQV